MVKLFCVIVGATGSVFPVDIDSSESVGDLKKAIKKEKMYQFPADELQLFLAKTEDGTWLDVARVAFVPLDEHGYPQGFSHMDPILWINNPEIFGDNFQWGERQVHVLVAIPGRYFAERDRDGGSSTENSYLSFWRSLESLFWPLERIEPTKKDV
ncbi:hypothetical protein PR003_g11598 [Phytophthora rubi]|uniref:Crinkler effector protein N-terminal domain-containing protein n=1 Tax=Phytophthora rubi TaxID=129364 RepID=A0A6A4FAN2_9STRA|nr:hypothetical protein PR002_g11580 [Phytophthora rubi]KAE9030414.1 hypothetical protein PR001_g11264 [Phytophthora rubi]KAE9338249.1 hypothetical protein PR003_g11598 [Phytophthora rubi]